MRTEAFKFQTMTNRGDSHWDGAMWHDPTHSSVLRRASWLSLSVRPLQLGLAGLREPQPNLLSHGSRVPRSSRLPVEQVPVSTTQWRAATVGRLGEEHGRCGIADGGWLVESREVGGPMTAPGRVVALEEIASW